MSRDFLNPEVPIEKKRDGDLPHWSQDEVMQFAHFPSRRCIAKGQSAPMEKSERGVPKHLAATVETRK